MLGEDDRLIAVLRQRLAHAGVSRLDHGVGVLVTAVGSSRPHANARTASVADHLWRTRVGRPLPHSPPDRTRLLSRPCRLLRDRGATRLVIAPWFLAHGRITDRVADYARAQGIPMARTARSAPAGGRDGPRSLRRRDRRPPRGVAGGRVCNFVPESGVFRMKPHVRRSEAFTDALDNKFSLSLDIHQALLSRY